MQTTIGTAVLGIAVAGFVVLAPAADAATVTPVKVIDFAFSPKLVTITRGSAVKWSNQSGFFQHSVTRTAGAWTINRTLSPGVSVSQTFPNPGTYSYHCRFHSVMVGKVVVK